MKTKRLPETPKAQAPPFLGGPYEKSLTTFTPAWRGDLLEMDVDRAGFEPTTS